MFKKVAKKVIDVIFVVIIIFVSVILLSNYMGFKTYVVRSGSMEPAIHTASVAIVNERRDFHDVEVGDVVAFKLQTGELVTHRVVELSKIDGITWGMTKGDNNEVADGYTVNIQNYYGTTIYSIPKLGYVVDWLSSTPGTIFKIGGLITLILLSILLDDDEEEEKDVEEAEETEEEVPDDDDTDAAGDTVDEVVEEEQEDNSEPWLKSEE